MNVYLNFRFSQPKRYSYSKTLYFWKPYLELALNIVRNEPFIYSAIKLAKKIWNAQPINKRAEFSLYTLKRHLLNHDEIRHLLLNGGEKLHITCYKIQK